MAFCLLCRHGQSRSPPALRPQARFGAQPPRQRRLLARRWRRNSPCGKRMNPNPVPSSAPVCALGHLPPRGKAFGRPSVPPLRRKGRLSGGPVCRPYEGREDFRAVRTPPLRKKRRLWGAPVGHSGVSKWAGFPPPPAGRAPLAHKFRKTGHPGPPGGAGSGWPLKKR